MEHTLFPGLTELILTALVFCGAQTVYALYGFGSGMISVALLAFVLPDLPGIVALLLLANLPTELWIAWRDRKNIRLRGAGWALAGMAVGIPAGSLLLSAGAGHPVLVRVLGVVVALFGLWLGWEAWKGVHLRMALPRGSGAVAGLLGGLLGGMFGTGGPPLILYFQVSGLDKADFRATLLGLFLVMALLRVPIYVGTGLIDGVVLLSTLAVLPAGLLGLALGTWLHAVVPERHFRLGVGGLLAVLGVLLSV